MIYLTLLLCLGCFGTRVVYGLDTVYEWKSVDFEWRNSDQKQMAINSGDYKVNSCIPFDVDEAPDGRVFVTLVRDAGVPVSVTTVSDKIGEGGPLLRPYPNWSWYESKNCNGITGVYRVAIARNNIYILDTGKIGSDEVCPPQLLIFDLSSDKLIDRIVIPSQYAANKNGTGLLVTPVIYFPRRRNAPIVYMADVEGYGLVEWDSRHSHFRRLESESFNADPSASRFTIGENSFDLADGLLGMAMSQDRPHTLYYRPLASLDMYHTKISNLKEARRDGKINFVKEPKKLRSQSAAQAISPSGILFFSSLSDFSLICWNRHKTFNNENTVQFAMDKVALEFPSGVKIVPKGFDGKLLVMTNRFPQAFNNKINFDDVNFRILKGDVHKIVRGTNCE